MHRVVTQHRNAQLSANHATTAERRAYLHEHTDKNKLTRQNTECNRHCESESSIYLIERITKIVYKYKIFDNDSKTHWEGERSYNRYRMPNIKIADSQQKK